MTEGFECNLKHVYFRVPSILVQNLFLYRKCLSQPEGGLAQLVERVLSMHEVAGSIPASSKMNLSNNRKIIF